MIYAIEFLDEDADLVVLEYNDETGDIKSFVSVGTTSDFKEPKRDQVYFCEKNEVEDLRNGRTRAWYEMIGAMSIHDDADCPADAYEAIAHVIESGEIVALFESFIETAHVGTDND